MNERIVLRRLRAMAPPGGREAVARFGIPIGRAYGVSVADVRRLARELGTDHDLAGRLWATGVREARLLATMVADPGMLTEEQADAWLADLDGWDVCDGFCSNLVVRTPFARRAVRRWAGREREFERRAGFALIAALAVHDKAASDRTFEAYFPIIRRGASDPRNFVKKAVSWALRQIGKRNDGLRASALRVAGELAASGDRTERWIGRDVERDLARPRQLR